MALTDTFVQQVKHSGKPAGDKHTNAAGMCALEPAAGVCRAVMRFSERGRSACAPDLHLRAFGKTEKIVRL